MPVTLKGPPELERVAMRGEPLLERWPGQSTTQRETMAASGNDRDWFWLSLTTFNARPVGTWEVTPGPHRAELDRQQLEIPTSLTRLGVTQGRRGECRPSYLRIKVLRDGHGSDTRETDRRTRVRANRARAGRATRPPQPTSPATASGEPSGARLEATPAEWLSGQGCTRA